VDLLPTAVHFNDKGKAVRVQWAPNGYYLTCSCIFAQEQYGKNGVYYCAHIQVVLSNRLDKLDSFKTINPVMEKVVVPAIYDKERRKAHALVMDLPAMQDGTLEVWFGEARIHDSALGYVRPTDSRAALIELARPYLIEYHLRTPCLQCAAAVTIPELRTIEGQTRAIILALQVASSPTRLCSNCKDLIPDI
jgi:hypothetical protein